jgi:hypothetical protein
MVMGSMVAAAKAVKLPWFPGMHTALLFNALDLPMYILHPHQEVEKSSSSDQNRLRQ